MFVAISLAIEKLTGTWLGDFLRKRIWGPLGMESTFFSNADARAYVEKANDPRGFARDAVRVDASRQGQHHSARENVRERPLRQGALGVAELEFRCWREYQHCA
jgi:CubicO group peptidase (beta-lactamase class C family)